MLHEEPTKKREQIFRALILETKNPQMKIFRNTMNYPEILRKTD